VKNRYLLLLIKEFQYRIRGIKFLKKLNIRKIYYRIRIKENKK